MNNGELNVEELEQVKGGETFEEALQSEINQLNRELMNPNNSTQERTQIYIKLEELKGRLSELQNNKYGKTF